MSKKPGLSPADHAALGLELARMRDRLTSISVQVGNAYPRSGVLSLYAQGLKKAIKAIDEARSRAERNLINDCGSEIFTPHVYYPDQRVRNPELHVGHGFVPSEEEKAWNAFVADSQREP